MFTPTSQLISDLIPKFPTPLFLTSEEVLHGQVRKMRDAFGPLGAKMFYAVKANFNPSIVLALKEAGIDGIDAVSPFEIDLAKQLGFTSDQIMFTGSNSSNEEIQYVGKQNVIQNLGSISELRRYAELFPNTKISLRLCPEVTAGESDKVKTGHTESKFGITLEQLGEVKEIIQNAHLELAGLHIHIGSGFYDPADMSSAVQTLATIAKDLKPTAFIDIGGGYGVSYHPDKLGLDLAGCAKAIEPILADLRKNLGYEIELRLEPGKILVTESTALLVTVTTIKEKGDIRFVGVDSGFNHLIRPTMYGSYHHIVNASRENGPLQKVRVVGNICETGDVLNSEIEMVAPREGDILAILCAGGYGSSMSSYYNLRPRAGEVLLKKDGSFLQTKRPETLDEILQTYSP